MSTLRTPPIPAPPPVAAVEAVAVAGVHRARLVDDDDERDVGLLLAVAHAHVDRQRLLERRVGVAAGAVAARPADHHEAPPEVADVDLERRHRRVREPQARDVDEHDRVVVGEPGEVRRQALGDDRVHDLALGLERGRPARAATSSSPLTTSTLGSPLTIVFASARSFWLNVSRAASTTIRKRRKPGVLGREVERDPGRARLEVHGLGAGQLAVDEQPHGGRLGDRRRDVAATRRSTRPGARSTGRRAAGRATSSRPPRPVRTRLDLDPARRGERRLGLAGAGGVVAVGEEDDPLLGVVGEQRRRRAAARRRCRSRRATGRRGDAVDLGELRREPLDQRVARRTRRSPPRPRPASRPATRGGRRAPPRGPACRPSRTGRRRTRRRAGRPAARAGARPGRRRAPRAAATRTASAARRRPLPSRRRDERWSAIDDRQERRQQQERAAGRRTRCPSGAPPAIGPRPAEARRDGPPQARERVALVDQPLER